MHWGDYFKCGHAAAYAYNNRGVQQDFLVCPPGGLPFERAVGNDGSPLLVFNHSSKRAQKWLRDGGVIWSGVCSELLVRNPFKPAWLTAHVIDMDEGFGLVLASSLATNAHVHVGEFERSSEDDRVYTWFAVEVNARLLSQIGPILAERCMQLMLSVWNEQPDKGTLKSVAMQRPEEAIIAHTPRLRGLWCSISLRKTIVGCSNTGMFDWMLEHCPLHPRLVPLTPEQISALPKHES